MTQWRKAQKTPWAMRKPSEEQCVREFESQRGAESHSKEHAPAHHTRKANDVREPVTGGSHAGTGSETCPPPRSGGAGSWGREQVAGQCGKQRGSCAGLHDGEQALRHVRVGQHAATVLVSLDAHGLQDLGD